MLNRFQLVLTAIALMGCASSDSQTIGSGAHYPTYREYLAVAAEQAIDDGPSKDAPGPTKLAYGECYGAFVMEYATPAETSKLDAFARGDSYMTVGEWKAAANDIVGRSGIISYSTIDRLAVVCPQDVPAFKHYFEAGFNGF